MSLTKQDLDAIETIINNRADSVEQNMAEGFEGVYTRLHSLEARLDSVETRLDSVETRLDHIETRLDSVETRLDHIETRLDSVETRLDNVEGRLDGMELRLDSIDYTARRIERVQEAELVRNDRQDATLKKLLKTWPKS